MAAKQNESLICWGPFINLLTHSDGNAGSVKKRRREEICKAIFVAVLFLNLTRYNLGSIKPVSCFYVIIHVKYPYFLT